MVKCSIVIFETRAWLGSNWLQIDRRHFDRSLNTSIGSRMFWLIIEPEHIWQAETIFNHGPIIRLAWKSHAAKLLKKHISQFFNPLISGNIAFIFLIYKLQRCELCSFIIPVDLNFYLVKIVLDQYFPQKLSLFSTFAADYELEFYEDHDQW